MKSEARVVVIGGGAVGTAILYHLAEAGVQDLLLIEKDELTSGSTWHAAGNIPTYSNSWLGMRAGNYAWSLYKDLGDKLDSPITYRHTGAFWPAHTKERLELFGHLSGVAESAGFDLPLLSPSEMEGMHPFWNAGKTVIGGIHDPYEGDIDPSQLTQALAKGARANGAEIARFTTVTSIERKAGNWIVGTDKGNVTAETLVSATGFYGTEVARLAGLYTPVATLEHQYLVTDQLAELEQNKALFPLVRDPEIRFYLRRECDAFLFGSYGHDGRVAWPDGPPKAFAHSLFPDSIEDMAEVLDQAISHVPVLATAGAQRFVNGPIAYAPDALPLVGPAKGAPNFYHACGVQIGITQSAAIGKAITEWITEGETEWDLSAWDPRRFGDWATPQYTQDRAAELYGLQYSIPYPHRLLQSGRPLKQTPLYDTLVKKGAVMGQIGGWERAFWFEAPEHKDDGHLSFHDNEPWFAAVKDECLGITSGVGIMDHGGFTKFEIQGPGATAYLDRLFCSSMPKIGKVKLSYMLTPKGKIWSEATIVRLAENHYLLCGPTLASDRDFDWLQTHVQKAEQVTLRQGFEKDAALLVMGPLSRDLLQPLTNADLSASNAPWMSHQELELVGAPVLALRVSYVGELGWELHLNSEHLVQVYDALTATELGKTAVHFGSYALNAMRIEKGYHAWGADFGIEYTPYDAGLYRFVNLNKDDFIGKAALEAIAEEQPDWEFWAFELDSPTIGALSGDPILIEDHVIGFVTSAAYGHRAKKQLALGYVRSDTVGAGEKFTIKILGNKVQATCLPPHVFDPENQRLKS